MSQKVGEKKNDPPPPSLPSRPWKSHLPKRKGLSSKHLSYGGYVTVIFGRRFKPWSMAKETTSPTVVALSPAKALDHQRTIIPWHGIGRWTDAPQQESIPYIPTLNVWGIYAHFPPKLPKCWQTHHALSVWDWLFGEVTYLRFWLVFLGWKAL